MPDIKTPMIVVYISLTQCAHQFCSVEMDSGDAYPSSVIYYCPVCEKQHSFNAKASYLVSTPLKMSAFNIYCAQVGISDFNVQVM